MKEAGSDMEELHKLRLSLTAYENSLKVAESYEVLLKDFASNTRVQNVDDLLPGSPISGKESAWEGQRRLLQDRLSDFLRSCMTFKLQPQGAVLARYGQRATFDFSACLLFVLEGEQTLGFYGGVEAKDLPRMVTPTVTAMRHLIDEKQREVQAKEVSSKKRDRGFVYRHPVVLAAGGVVSAILTGAIATGLAKLLGWG